MTDARWLFLDDRFVSKGFASCWVWAPTDSTGWRLAPRLEVPLLEMAAFWRRKAAMEIWSRQPTVKPSLASWRRSTLACPSRCQKPRDLFGATNDWLFRGEGADAPALQRNCIAKGTLPRWDCCPQAHSATICRCSAPGKVVRRFRWNSSTKCLLCSF